MNGPHRAAPSRWAGQDSRWAGQDGTASPACVKRLHPPAPACRVYRNQPPRVPLSTATCTAVLLNPTLLRSLLSVNLESGMPATVPESHWQGVVASLALAPAQRHDVLAVFDLYRGVIAKVRRRVCACGQYCSQSDCNEGADAGGVATGA